VYNFFDPSGTIDDHDAMGNMYINTGNFASASQMQAATCKYGFNVFADADDTFNLNYGGDIITTEAALNMGDFRYTKFKLTNPTIATIVGVVPTSSTPLNVRTLVPMSGPDQIGSRVGIGLDDVF